MQQPSQKKLFHVDLELSSGRVRNVTVTASNAGVAGHRALKRTAKAVKVIAVKEGG